MAEQKITITSPSAYVATRMAQHKAEEREAAQELLNRWVQENSARPCGRQYGCLRRLANPQHHCNSNACYAFRWPHALDHAEWWTGPNGEFIVTAHPYEVGENDRRELARIAEEYGATLAINREGSWYWPGTTWLVVLQGRCPSRRTVPYCSYFPYLSAREALIRARERGYIVARNNANERGRARSWWAECQEESRPYVRIIPRKTLAAVELDMEPAGRLLAEPQVAQLNALLHEYIDARRCFWLSHGEYGAYAPAVRASDAEELARLLYEIATAGA